MRFLLVFSPVFCGLLAGFLYLMDIRSPEAIASAGSELEGAAIFAGILTLAFGVIVAPRTLGSILLIGRDRGSPARYQEPRIISAQVTNAILFEHEGPIRAGEFEVSANHWRHVSSRLAHLPTGSKIQTIERGSLYRILFPIQPPIRGAATDQTDRWYVEEAARANGYKGRIQ